MAKTKSKAILKPKLKIIGSLLIVALLLLIAFQLGMRAAVRDDPTAVREVLISSAERIKLPAPVDAKSGDVYFSDLKLTVPKSATNADLTYDYIEDEVDGRPLLKTLSLGNRQLFGEHASAMYNATNSTEVFEKLPELQACQKAVSITASPILHDDNFNLNQKKQLADGRTIYIYTNGRCQEATRVIEQIKDIQSY